MQNITPHRLILLQPLPSTDTHTYGYSFVPEDGCKQHPKHVELRIKKNKEYIKMYI
jgi:hypothetical protein